MHRRAAARHRLAWLGNLTRAHRGMLALALVLGFATVAFSCALMFTSGYLISGAAQARGSILLLYVPIIYVRVFGGGKPLLAYLERLLNHDWVLRLTSQLRLRLYQALERRSRTGAAGGRRGLQVGAVLGMLAEDIGHLQNLYLRSVAPTVIGWTLYAVVLCAAGALSPALAAAFGLGCAAAAIGAPLASLAINGPREERSKEAKHELYTSLTDAILGVADWVCSGRRGDYLRLGEKARRRAHRAQREERRFDRRRDAVIRLSFGLTVVLVLAWSGARFGGANGVAADVTVWIAAFVLGLFPLFDQFASLPAALGESRGHLAAIDHMQSLENEGEAQGSATGDKEAAIHNPDIELSNVHFTYHGATRETLRGVSLAITHGQHIAILGRSGAGKSTLAALLHGDRKPDSGFVRLNDIDAYKLAEQMPDLVGVIQQQIYLFNTTLYDNLCVARSNATREEARAALERVGLDPLLERLPQGLDTMVDEGGLRFSGGERHRIALARVLLRNTPIVLLDEPFAGLDPLTEQALLDMLFTAFADRTLILITHHLQGIEAMDHVVFMEEGSIELDGSPASLERASQRYRDLLAFDRGL